MSNNKYKAVKVFLTTFFPSVRVILFSQISHEDSLQYLGYLKLNAVIGKDLKGTTMPGFIIKDKNGDSLTHDNLRSKISFINFKLKNV